MGLFAEREARKGFPQNVLIGGGAFLLLSFAIYLIWDSSNLLSQSEFLAPSAKVLLHGINRQTQIIIFAVLIIVPILFLLFRRISLLESRLEKSFDFQYSGQLTRAIEQLGTHKVESQLAGILTLDRIAKESRADYLTVMEVLTAYVRENSKYIQQNENGFTSTPHLTDSEEPMQQIQAILSLIARRYWLEEEIDAGKVLNLRRTNLEKLDLRRARLERMNLRGVNLHKANLTEASLVASFLAESDLSHINLARANLSGTKFIGANLENANLKEADLEGADLSRANLRSAVLVHANLDGANLSGANLEDTNLSGVTLTNANLTNTNLNRVKYDRETSFPEWIHLHIKEQLEMELLEA